MSGPAPIGNHLDDVAIQGLADGTLRGPEGFAAHEHCDACPDCSAELQLYQSLTAQLSSLSDPQLPEDFTCMVLSAAADRELALSQRRQISLAAIPAAGVALIALVGWALSAGPAQRLNQLIDSLNVCRQVLDVALPVVSAARMPLFLATFAVSAILFAVLVRVVRGGAQTPTIARS